MTVEQKQVKSKVAIKEAAIEGVEQLEQVSKEAQQKVTEAVAESTEKVKVEAKELQENVEKQIHGLKQDLIQRIDVIKQQFNYSQKDLTELKAFVKSEINAVIVDLSKFGKELKMM